MPVTSISRALGCVIVAIMTLHVLGCDTHTGLATAHLATDDVHVKIQTDHRQYRFSSDPRVHVSMENVGPAPVYTRLPSFFVRLEALRDGRWQDLGTWYGILAVAGRVVPFFTGDTLAADLPLHSSVLRSPGTYRFVYDLYRDSRLTRSLPRTLLLSNTFEVVD